MKNPFKTSSRTSLPRQSANMKKEIRVLYDDPIVFGHAPEPAEEPPATSENGGDPLVCLIAGSVLVLLCLGWLAPDWLGNIWNNLITQIFHSAGP